jgi:hypothetical protein
MVNNGFHPHVWFKNSGDVFVRNIVMTDHKDIRLQGWGKEIDYNLFPDEESLEKARSNGIDLHSAYGDPLFIEPSNANFRILENSPALSLGFKNFSMDSFGVQKPELKKIAKTPDIPPLLVLSTSKDAETSAEWLGANIKNIETMGERSAAGLKDISGVLIILLPENCLAANSGLQEGDVILQCEGNTIRIIQDLLNCYQGNNWKGVLKLLIVRNQQEKEINLDTK